MRRLVVRKRAVSISLFPFLAVLLCTMGCLIVLLVMVVQQARVQASAVDDLDPQSDVLRQQRLEEEFRWQREVLEEKRQEAAEQLTERRLVLSHLESHLREITDRFELVRAEIEDLANLDSFVAEKEATAQKLAKLDEEIRIAERELEESQQASASQVRNFSIIPYDGPNGTQRKPLYVECTGRGIIIQPEGIELQISDFEGPLGPGNPLDAVLRAKREYFAKHGGVAIHGEPYPLLIVRPDGVMAYVAARAAMKSWDDEFGYELIDDKKQLAFEDVDPILTLVLEQTIEDARRRQEILAAAMPARFKGKQSSSSGFIAAPNGGFQRVGQGASRGRGVGKRREGISREAGTSDSENFAESKQLSSSEAMKREHLSRRGAAQTGSQHRKGPEVGGQANGNQAAGQIEPMAETRGSNFGLPKADVNLREVKRPLHVVCMKDRLLLLPDEGDSRPTQVTLFSEDVRGDMDAFIAGIWSHMERWGLALSGGYWKPILQVDVKPGGEQRFRQLQVLLDDSGIVVRRKSL